MFNIFFRYYLKQEEYNMLIKLNGNQIKKIWENENISLNNKLKIIFQNKHYEIFSSFEDKVIDEIINNKREFDLTDDQIVKILCQRKNYDRIGQFLETLDEIRDSSWLNDDEIVLSGLSCIYFSRKKLEELIRIGLDNLTGDEKKERYELERFIASTKNVVRRKANGIKKLFKEHHPFFEEHFSKIASFDFLNFCVEDDLVSFLYTHGYNQIIQDNLFKFHRPVICDLFSHNEIKKELISREFLIQKMDIPEIFKDLPLNQKSLIAYYGCEFFECQNYTPVYLQEAQENLKELFENNFQDILTKELQEEIIKLYGLVPSYAIEVLIDKVMLDSNHLEKIYCISSKYLNKRRDLCFILDAKYPNIFNPLFLGNVDPSDELRYKLIYLSKKPVLEEINTLEDISRISLNDLKTFCYSIQNQKNKKAILEKVSPTNYNNGKLFLYQNEILIIKRDGESIESNVEYSHPETLSSEYSNIMDTEVMDEREVLYEANMMGDVIGIIENLGIILYFPPTISTNQKIKLIELIHYMEGHERRNEIILNGGFAIPDTKCEYVHFNDGDKISTLELMNEINKLKVDDEGKMLHPSVIIKKKKK